METCPREGVVKEKFPNTRKLSYQWVCGEFWNLRGQHNQELKKKKKPTEYHLTTTPSEEARMLSAATSERGVNREAQVACLG